MGNVVSEDWTPQTLPTWLHSIWVGVVDPWIVISKGPRIWYKTVREIVTIVRMHQVRAPGMGEGAGSRACAHTDGRACARGALCSAPPSAPTCAWCVRGARAGL